ncbi:thiaminase (transcriptional activator TenA) [Apostasia shenzhenica]|uniref:Thiaminase (Transcriptional activator TenA) n=1 Tax=Apostasia shenzhenica TaxID=1088818 RepID=A0A2H9ZYT7_9ASPA|nr:thiaminase (transcriptional activator TenA) [Apostasia shenzhenica]
MSSPGSQIAGAVGFVQETFSASKKFWLESQKEATLVKYTPFVVCLASGKLELETFRQYIAQDIHFLRSFVNAYEKADEYADDDDAKAAISKLRKAVLKEIRLHDSIVQDWGIDPSEEISPNPATIKYTNFLSATSDGKGEGGKDIGKIVTPFEKTKIAAYAVGAMVPCLRLFAYIGKELELFLKHSESEHRYASWLKCYLPSTFEEAAIQIEDLLDKLSVSLTGEELDVIRKLYRHALKLEIEFFQAQPIVQPVVVPLTRLLDSNNCLFIFSDFDLTCSAIDSSAILAEIAIIKAPKSMDILGVDDVVDRISSSELRDSWKALSGQYTEEYEQCIDNLLKDEQAKSFNLEALYKRLEQLSEFEKRANSRVVQSGVLKGMNIDDIKRAGEHLNLQEGCAGFFQNIVREKGRLNLNLHVLSYCWCADLIRSSFSSVGCLSDLTIHSNELIYDGGLISTGEIVRKMESPLDKVHAFKSIIGQNSSENHLSVYIGDSAGDLLCLLEADVGILVGSSKSLRKVGKHFGISFVPLFEGLISKQRELGSDGSSVWRGQSGVLFTASGWPEIQAFILGI